MKISKYVLRSSIALGVMLIGMSIAYASVTPTLLPTAHGAYTQWTPSIGTNHSALVDETPCNGTTDYNFTNTTGQRDSYRISLASIPHGSTITQISITPCASRNKSGRGISTMNVFYRYDGINSADAGAYALLGIKPVDLSTTTFSGLSHMVASGSIMEIGAVYSGGRGLKGARLSRITTQITYTFPASFSFSKF